MADRVNVWAYQVLRGLSHARNRQTEAEVAANAARRRHQPAQAQWFLSFVRPHITVAEQAVLDIGCGFGDLGVCLAQEGARRVVGVDIDPVRVAVGQRLTREAGLMRQVQFAAADFVRDFETAEQFDVIVSLDAFEHILDPVGCLRKAYRLLRPGGRLATLFGPLWLSPYGGHTWGFTPWPWVHLLFPEAVVLRVRQECYRPGQAAVEYAQIVGHLSRMTVARFKASLAAAGFHRRVFRLNPDKDRTRGGLLRPLNDLVNAVPGLREFGAQLLLAVLEKPASAGPSPSTS